jgi:glycosyltransferase involved in cell wall biosynthesis
MNEKKTLDSVLFLGIPLERRCGVSKAQLEMADALRQEGIKVDHLSGWPNKREHNFSSNNGNSQSFNGLESFLKFATKEGLSYDILHSHSWAWAPMSRLDSEGIADLKKHFDGGVVHTFHSYLPSEEKAQRDILPHVDGIIHLTPQGESTFCDIFRDSPQYFSRISVLPNLVTIVQPNEKTVNEIQEKISPSGERVILYVGRISQEKGTHLLAEAYNKIRKLYPETRLVFVGDENSSGNGEISVLKEHLGIDNQNVSFAGWVDEITVAAYQEATRRTGGIQFAPSNYESFNLAISKALAISCPIAISYIPTLRGIYNLDETTPYGVAIKDVSVDGIVQAFSFFVENPELVAERTASGKTGIINKYSPQKVANQYIDVYNELL